MGASPRPVSAGHPSNISIRVTNIGRIAGDEVVFAFFSATPAGLVPTAAEVAQLPGSELRLPQRQLFGFERVRLGPGESTVVRFSARLDDITLVDMAGRRWNVAGSYTLSFSNGVGRPLLRQVEIGRSAARLVSELPAGTGAV